MSCWPISRLRSSGIRANASIFFLNLLGLPNALIYAGVWPLAIRGLGRYTKLGSSLLIMGLCGNAILPLLYGFVAQHWGMRTGYWVLIPCFLYLLLLRPEGIQDRTLALATGKIPRMIWNA